MGSAAPPVPGKGLHLTPGDCRTRAAGLQRSKTGAVSKDSLALMLLVLLVCGADRALITILLADSSFNRQAAVGLGGSHLLAQDIAACSRVVFQGRGHFSASGWRIVTGARCWCDMLVAVTLLSALVGV